MPEGDGGEARRERRQPDVAPGDRDGLLGVGRAWQLRRRDWDGAELVQRREDDVPLGGYPLVVRVDDAEEGPQGVDVALLELASRAQ